MSTPSLNSKFEKTAQWNDHHVQVTFKVKAASIVEGAGAVAVKALKCVIAGRENKEIKAAVTISTTINIYYLDESEVLTPADEQHHINKNNYKVPFETAELKRLPAPANTAMMTQLGCDGVFVGSGIFNLVKKEPKQL
ncbi:18351_t:CDS:2 [Entrophospora sp. SA101]|nr:18351_t:CDS:2 [Entrophospora sp. SA101]